MRPKKGHGTWTEHKTFSDHEIYLENSLTGQKLSPPSLLIAALKTPKDASDWKQPAGNLPSDHAQIPAEIDKTGRLDRSTAPELHLTPPLVQRRAAHVCRYKL